MSVLRVTPVSVSNIESFTSFSSMFILNREKHLRLQNILISNLQEFVYSM